MNQDKYIKTVLNEVKCSRKDKFKIKEDLKSDIALALANGETWEEIEERLGTPKELASDLNENFEYPIKSNSTRNLVIGIFIGIGIVIIAGVCIFNYFVPKSDSIEDSKIFNENTLNEKVQVVIDCLNTDDYDRLMSISDDLMQKNSTQEGLNSAIETLGDLGEFKSITRSNFAEVKDQGTVFAVGEIVALYENKSVTYTISFDKDMKLVGLYMK